MEELRESYRELSPELHQTGLDDRGGFGEDRYAYSVAFAWFSVVVRLRPCTYTREKRRKQADFFAGWTEVFRWRPVDFFVSKISTREPRNLAGA